MSRSSHHRLLLGWLLATAFMLGTCTGIAGQSPASGNSASSKAPEALEREFFAALRDGDAQKVLSYIPEGGVNVGPEARHASRDEVEQQFRSHRGLYCKLFDSSCIEAPINLENSARTCSYRELLTHSNSVRTASSEVTRSGVRQAVLVARIKNDRCPKQNLIDFIFNLEADGWKLFSIP